MVGRVNTSAKPVGSSVKRPPAELPVGLRTDVDRRRSLKVLAEVWRVSFWPAVPVKVRVAFSPMVVVVIVVGVPIVVVPVLSATGVSRKVMVPVCWSRGSTSTRVGAGGGQGEDVVEAGRAVGEQSAAGGAARGVEDADVDPGAVVKVLAEVWRVSFWPAVAVNVRVAFSPMVVVVTVVGVPIVVVPVLSATGVSRKVMVPVCCVAGVDDDACRCRWWAG